METTKYFLITNDQFNPIYRDLPENTSIESFIFSLNFFTEILHENASIIKFGDFKVVIITSQDLIFLVMSKGNESDASLRKQLTIVQNLFDLAFGKQFLVNVSLNRSRIPIQAQPKMRVLIDALINLSNNHQHFLVHAVHKIEKQNLAETIKEKLLPIIQENESIIQILFFVDTKLLIQLNSNHKPRIKISSEDIFLLLIYIHAVLDYEQLTSSEKFDDVPLETSENESVDFSNEIPINDCDEELYFRLPNHQPLRVYSAKTTSNTKLVLILRQNSSLSTENLREIAHRFRYSVRHHVECLSIPSFTILPYVSKYPGIIHFIFVDRNRNRVIAPDFTSLHEVYKIETPNIENMSKNYIKSKVWDLSSHAQTFLEKEGEKLLINEKLPSLENLSQENSFHIQTIQKLFRSKKVYCYEIYTLYSAALSSETAANFNNCLISDLFSYFMDSKN
ncbi:hermansky-pudlak syndrome protein [Anaeramoeba ignava]|uniref:Hermansky-pudlak syndrome protein n=1 Tax=Anaeramoeba ignava TaxID=1746090 RepID=A0A9Q0RCR7_ANAIG|nr:hermansky-pudlak syndrome protein [Anaeramoeba ignava]